MERVALRGDRLWCALVAVGASNAREQGHCVLIGELLSGDARYEMSAADQPARLEAAQRPQDVPPRNGKALPNVDLAADDAPPVEQLPRDALGELVGIERGLDYRQERPAPLHPLPPASTAATLAGLRSAATRPAPLAAGEARARVQERANGVEPVRGDEPAGDPVPETFLDLGGQTASDRPEVGVELGAVLTQRVEHRPRRAA